MMTNLFNELPGFRLHRLELYNWGTFNGRVYCMETGSVNAVLTGANGSGKSTIVDALLTLLVPNRERDYNMASGTDKRKERSERSYVRGAYSRSFDEASQSSQANYLREKSEFTVILGVFQNESLKKTISLAQVLRETSSIQKDFYVANQELSIEKHFSEVNQLKSRLRAMGVEICASFEEYRQSFSRMLGIRSKQAITLFNKTVSVKDIASLNHFIRNYMLDEDDWGQQVESLQAQYGDLLQAFRAIQKAKQQLAILEPLVTAGESYRDASEKIFAHQSAARLIPFYVADRKLGVLREEIQIRDKECQTKTEEKQSEEERLSLLQDDERQLQNAIDNSEVGQRKKAIETELKSLRRQLSSAQDKARKYDSLAKSVQLQLYTDREAFEKNRTEIDTAIGAREEEIRQLDSELFEARSKAAEEKVKRDELLQELDYLRKNPSQIPSGLAAMREKIAKALDIDAHDLPFIGELLQVRESENAWLGALERLFHSFALEILVPEQTYSAITEYLEKTKLDGRLVYRRIGQELAPNDALNGMGDYAFEKLDIKEDSPYYHWLHTQLQRNFDYHCCNSLAEFRQASRAITIKGQIKHSNSRHEKNDRYALNEKSRYVMGWDNRGKIASLEKELAYTEKEMDAHERKSTRLGTQIDSIRKQIEKLQRLADIENYEEIDWRSTQKRVDALEEELQQLAAESIQLQNLEKKLSEQRQEISRVKQKTEKLSQEIGVLSHLIRTHEAEIEACEALLNRLNDELRMIWEAHGSIIKEADQIPNRLEALNRAENQLQGILLTHIQQYQGEQQEASTRIIQQILEFKTEYREDSAHLDSSIESLPDFVQIFYRIQQDDLPSYEERFEHYLSDEMATSIIRFRQKLEAKVEEIKAELDEINRSLKKIAEQGSSHIRLVANNSPNDEIKKFRQRLKDAIPNFGRIHEPEERKRSFEKIQDLIQAFGSDPAWMQRVVDTRRWLDFSAEELRDGVVIDYYNDSSGKSGGQKAKLAYTILAAALAYQYGVHSDYGMNGNSFRFVVIDEAFSKLDDDNAHYAMSLFQNLGLQLLVVTPQEKTHVIQKYVKAYHVVWYENEINESKLINLNSDDYARQAREKAMQ